MLKPDQHQYHQVVIELTPQRFWQYVQMAQDMETDVLTEMHKALNQYAEGYFYNPPAEG